MTLMAFLSITPPRLTSSVLLVIAGLKLSAASQRRTHTHTPGGCRALYSLSLFYGVLTRVSFRGSGKVPRHTSHSILHDESANLSSL